MLAKNDGQIHHVFHVLWKQIPKFQLDHGFNGKLYISHYQRIYPLDSPSILPLSSPLNHLKNHIQLYQTIVNHVDLFRGAPLFRLINVPPPKNQNHRVAVIFMARSSLPHELLRCLSGLGSHRSVAEFSLSISQP